MLIQSPSAVHYELTPIGTHVPSRHIAHIQATRASASVFVATDTSLGIGSPCVVCRFHTEVWPILIVAALLIRLCEVVVLLKVEVI